MTLAHDAAPSRDVVPPVGSRRASLSWLLVVALLALVLTDFALPMRRGLSLVLLALTSLLAMPWATRVVRGGGASGGGASGGGVAGGASAGRGASGGGVAGGSSALGASAGGASAGRASSGGAEVWFFRLGIIALAAIVLSAKWWLYIEAAAAAPEHFIGSSRSYAVALGLLFVLGPLGSGLLWLRFLALVSEHPARLIVLSFGATGVLGGLALSLPVSLQRVSELSMLDNLFMSFSAVCVTGLSVNNLASTYTWFGQGVLCLLIQIGGLGIMVLSAAVALMMGQRLRVKSHAVFAEMVDAESLSQLRQVILGIVVATFMIEGLVGLLMYQRFSQLELPLNPAIPANPAAARVWAAVFHAVSGFCNAGFSCFEAGLVPFVGDPTIMLGVTSLIVLGGVGFPVIQEIAARAARLSMRRRRERLSLHARISLGWTLVLLVGIAAAYLVLEWHVAFGALAWHEKLLAALFHSASCRTAGFNVIDVGAMRPASLMLTCVAMFIGACPGSCAGGIKTTTVAVLFAGLRSELQGRPAYLLDRAVPLAMIRKAIGVAFTSFGLVAVFIFLLLLVEPHEPLSLAFEAFSGFSTTGLSTGITPALSPAGKVLVLSTMYIGRIGPLTLALAISGRLQQSPIQLPSERVLIG
jgi:trk/ktr system potassium uptake protein